MFVGNVSTVNLSEVSINITDGAHNTITDCPDGKYYLLSCKNIKGGQLSIGNRERRISGSTFDGLRRRTKLEKGDILLTSVGTVGEALLLNEAPENYEFQRSVAMIKPDYSKISSSFIYFTLLAQKEEIIHAAHGAVQQCLFIKDIGELKIPTVDKKLVEKFDFAVQPMLDTMTVNRREIERLSSLRDLLLPKLMSGEIDVSKVGI